MKTARYRYTHSGDVCRKGRSCAIDYPETTPNAANTHLSHRDPRTPSQESDFLPQSPPHSTPARARHHRLGRPHCSHLHRCSLTNARRQRRPLAWLARTVQLCRIPQGCERRFCCIYITHGHPASPDRALLLCADPESWSDIHWTIPFNSIDVRLRASTALHAIMGSVSNIPVGYKLFSRIVHNPAMKQDPPEIYGWRAIALACSAGFGAMYVVAPARNRMDADVAQAVWHGLVHHRWRCRPQTIQVVSSHCLRSYGVMLRLLI